MKKLGKLLLALVLVVILPAVVNAKGKEPIKVHIFRGEGCGYCAKALEFFKSIENDYGNMFDLEEHEVWYDKDNEQLMQDVASYFNEEVGGVPYIIIGDKTFQGYASDYDDEIKSTIKDYYNNGNFEDRVAQVQGGDKTKKDSKKDDKKTTIVIIAVAVVGMVALLFFARDTKDVVKAETKKEVKAEKVEVKEEPKKAPVKKAPAKKAPAKKPAAKKAPAKKTTTKKTAAKKKTTSKK